MKWIGLKATFVYIKAKLDQENLLRMVRWVGWHCPADTWLKIRTLDVWGRARYLSLTEAPHNTVFHEWMGKKHACFFQTSETGKRTPNSSVKGSGANHCPRAPASRVRKALWCVWVCFIRSLDNRSWGVLNCISHSIVYGIYPTNTISWASVDSVLAIVSDSGPTLKQHWFSVPRLCSLSCYPSYWGVFVFIQQSIVLAY